MVGSLRRWIVAALLCSIVAAFVAVFVVSVGAVVVFSKVATLFCC